MKLEIERKGEGGEGRGGGEGGTLHMHCRRGGGGHSRRLPSSSRCIVFLQPLTHYPHFIRCLHCTHWHIRRAMGARTILSCISLTVVFLWSHGSDGFLTIDSVLWLGLIDSSASCLFGFVGHTIDHHSGVDGRWSRRRTSSYNQQEYQEFTAMHKNEINETYKDRVYNRDIFKVQGNGKGDGAVEIRNRMYWKGFEILTGCVVVVVVVVVIRMSPAKCKGMGEVTVWGRGRDSSVSNIARDGCIDFCFCGCCCCDCCCCCWCLLGSGTGEYNTWGDWPQACEVGFGLFPPG